jgi:hypothetical protein
MSKSVWTEEKVQKLTEGYVPQDMASVEQLAEELEVSKRAVIGKLVHMGAYVAPEKPKAKPKDEGPTKGEILQAIAETGFEVEGLESAKKAALARLRDYLQTFDGTSNGTGFVASK